MTDKELLVILRNENKKKVQMQKDLVKERVKLTSKEKFDIKEIYYFSQYFGISMQNFLLDVLAIDKQEYKKFVKGHLLQVYSEIYTQMKEDYINRKKKIFQNRINWNKKTYYNKKRLLKSANKLDINVCDFSLKILEKRKECMRRVLKDDKSRRRLGIGQYVNTELPQGYLDANKDKIILLAKGAIKRAVEKLGVSNVKIDYEEELQKCLLYINYNGNSLNRKSIPKINSNKMSKTIEKNFFYKMMYYEINELKNYKPETEYIENLVYKNSSANFYDIEDEKQFLETLSLDNKENKIAESFIAGYSEEEIMAKENIGLDEINRIKDKIKEKYLESRKSNLV